MAKLTLTDVANITGSETSAIAAINDNNSALEAALENTLSRDGTSPNAMNFDFDMNGYDIINAGFINGQDANDLTGPQGPPGVDGTDGADGTAATVTVGSTTTLTAGSSATATNVGTTSAAIINFGIPRGADGAGTGDVVGPSSSVDNEIALFNSTTGKLIKRASTTGILKGTSGVLSAATAGTDYYNPGGTDVAVADGGTGSSTASGARTNLGLVIGTDVQAADSDLTTIAGLTATTDNFIQSKSSAWASRTPTQVTADLIAVVGDSGSGGTKGLVPAPASGDTAAGKFLKANGTWAVPSGSGGSNANTYLEWIYQSKLYAGYRRGIELFADGYKASDGVSSVTNGAVNTTSGYVGPTTTGGGNDSFSIALLNMNGSNASTTFTDIATASPHTWTANGNAQISTAQSEFGGSSGAFDGSGDYLSSPSHADFSYPGDFTIEAWVRFNVVTGTQLLYGTNVASGLGFGYLAGTGLFTVKAGVALTASAAWSPTANTWYHIAVARQSGTSRFFVNGTQIGTNQSDSFSYPQGGGQIGADSGPTSYLNGYVNGFRLSKGVARYTTTFTPRTTAWTTSPDNMTVVSTTQTADATVSNGRVLMEIDPIDAITLNTDLTVEITCNGGTNYTTCTLTSSGKGQSGRTVVDTGVQAIANSGTSFAARIKTLNNKSVNIYGTTLEVS